jgi:hypothetical protein
MTRYLRDAHVLVVELWEARQEQANPRLIGKAAVELAKVDSHSPFSGEVREERRSGH